MRLILKHLSPWLSSATIWLFKWIGLVAFPKVPVANLPRTMPMMRTVGFADLMLWSLTSLLSSAVWRICVDDRTLMTAVETKPGTGSRRLLYAERGICAVAFVVLIYFAGQGAENVLRAGLVLPIFIGYFTFPLYLLLGIGINLKFGSILERHRRLRGSNL